MRPERALFGALCLLAVPLVAAAAAPTRGAPVVLAGKGLVVRGAQLRFGTPRTQTMKMVTAALGPATKVGVYPECGGDHPIGYAKFRGLELSFVGGKLVGWTLDSGTAKTANGVGIGVTVRTVRRLIPGVVIDKGNEEGGGIGPGFNSETSVNGWLDGIAPTSKVLSLYAGETCIVE